jgi:NADH-quinone oxidoreductase subunit G
MPRQNEWVNEIWICDKGRFAYHYSKSKERLSQPLIRKEGGLVPAAWEEALEIVSRHFRQAGEGLLTLAGGRLSNEDLFNLRQLTTGLGGQTALYTTMAGGNLVTKVGVGQGTNFADMRAGTAILVVACDLEEEAPIWWLRVKQAAERGVILIVANPRPTKIERYAQHIIRYPYGNEAAAVLAMVNALSAKRPNLPTGVQALSHSSELQAAVKAFTRAENAVILFGSEGTGLKASQSLAQACANLLIATNHIGRPNNGLVPVWQRANEQGAWDMGFRPLPDLKATMKLARALYVVAADPAGDDPNLAETADFLVVQDLFLTGTAKLADVVLPAQAFTEREGSFTSGERRVQRFYPAVPARPSTLADFAITGKIGKLLGIDLEAKHASRVMERIAASIPDYAGLSYAKLAEVVEQWPIVGCGNLYFSGTSYENLQGQGVQLAPAAQRGEQVALGWSEPPAVEADYEGLLGVPVTFLYDRGQTVMPSILLHQRIHPVCVVLNPDEATQLGIATGELVQLQLNGSTTLAAAKLDEGVPAGIALIPRSLGIPIAEPLPMKIQSAEKTGI